MLGRKVWWKSRFFVFLCERFDLIFSWWNAIISHWRRQSKQFVLFLIYNIPLVQICRKIIVTKPVRKSPRMTIERMLFDGICKLDVFVIFIEKIFLYIFCFKILFSVWLEHIGLLSSWIFTLILCRIRKV